MNHEFICMAMAKRVGQTITPELAVEMVNEMQAAVALAPTMREKVERLEASMESLPQAECPVRNIFAPGIYAREMTIPAGVTLTGAVHKTEHLSIISAGRIMVNTDDGVKELAAPCIFVSKPGAKRAGHAIETTVWTTIHATDETDLEKLMEELTESTIHELLGGANNRQLLQQPERQRLEA